MEDDELEVKIVKRLAKKRVVGNENMRVDTMKNRGGFASHERGRVEDAIRDLVRDPDAPVESYGGGHRDNIRLTGMREAKNSSSNTATSTTCPGSYDSPVPIL